MSAKRDPRDVSGVIRELSCRDFQFLRSMRECLLNQKSFPCLAWQFEQVTCFKALMYVCVESGRERRGRREGRKRREKCKRACGIFHFSQIYL